MPNCCGGASCACKIAEGEGISVSGSGTAADPFVITANQEFSAVDNTTFNVTIGGTGSVLTPWTFEVAFASTAKLDDVPDVQAPSPTNGQVLGWDNTLQRWTPRAPTTAPTGAVTHDPSLQGDGSVGDPLRVNANSTKGIEATASGVGLSDATMNSLVRRYTDATERSAATPAPVLNSLSQLATNPGQIEYWDGDSWEKIKASYDSRYLSTAFMEMSGPFNGTSRLTRVVKKVEAVTGPDGTFDVLTVADLTGVAGVLSVQFTPIGTDVLTPTAWSAVLFPATDHVTGYGWTVGDLGPVVLNTVTVQGMVEAWTY